MISSTKDFITQKIAHKILRSTSKLLKIFMPAIENFDNLINNNGPTDYEKRCISIIKDGKTC